MKFRVTIIGDTPYIRNEPERVRRRDGRLEFISHYTCDACMMLMRLVPEVRSELVDVRLKLYNANPMLMGKWEERFPLYAKQLQDTLLTEAPVDEKEREEFMKAVGIRSPREIAIPVTIVEWVEDPRYRVTIIGLDDPTSWYGSIINAMDLIRKYAHYRTYEKYRKADLRTLATDEVLVGVRIRR